MIDVLLRDSAYEIMCSLDTPKTALEIIEDTDLSNATVYRWLDRLEDSELVYSFITIPNDGKPVKSYVRFSDEVTIEFGQSSKEALLVRKEKA